MSEAFDVIGTVVGFFADILRKLFEFAPVSGTLGLLIAVIYIPRAASVAQFRKDMRDYYHYKYSTGRPFWKKAAYWLLWPFFKLDDAALLVVGSWWPIVRGIGRGGLLFVAFVIAGKALTTLTTLGQARAPVQTSIQSSTPLNDR